MAHWVHAPSWSHNEHRRFILAPLTKDMSISGGLLFLSRRMNTSGRHSAHAMCAWVPGDSHATSQADGGSSLASAPPGCGHSAQTPNCPSLALPTSSPSLHPTHIHSPSGTFRMP